MLNPGLGFTMEIVTDVERKSDHDIYITDKGNKVKSYDGRLIPYYQKKPPPFVFNHRKYGWWVSEHNKLGAGPRWGSNDAGDAAPTTCVEGTCTIAGGGYRNRKSAKKVRRRRQNKVTLHQHLYRLHHLHQLLILRLKLQKPQRISSQSRLKKRKRVVSVFS